MAVACGLGIGTSVQSDLNDNEEVAGTCSKVIEADEQEEGHKLNPSGDCAPGSNKSNLTEGLQSKNGVILENGNESLCDDTSTPRHKEPVSKKDKLVSEVAIQANDYDIERRSGKIPSRRRVIPFKFRDYRNPDLVDDTGIRRNSDSDYDPDDAEVPRVRRKRPRGRPRKYASVEVDFLKGETNDDGKILKEQDGEQSKTSAEDILGDGGDVIPVEKIETQHDLVDQVIKVIHLDQVGPIIANGQEVQVITSTNEISGETENANIVISETENANIVISETGNENAVMMETGSEDTGKAETGSDNTVTMVTAHTKQIGDIDKLAHGHMCTVCNKMFSTKGNLKTHQRIHTDFRPFACDAKGCNKSFRSNETLRRHRLSHMGVKQFECTVCEKKFSSNVSLQEHMSRHTDTKPYQCHMCLRNFRQVSCLRRHLLTHSSDMPFSCPICSRRFSQMVYLRSHMKVHTGEKPYKCQVENCGKAFAHHSDLNRHKIIHSGQKPYLCDVCGARFSDPSSRRRHEREHVGIKPYPCQLCGEAFKRAGQLKGHLSRKHSNEQEGVQVVRSSNGTLLFLFKDTNKEMTSMLQEQGGDKQTKQKKIVKLIEDLNSSMVQHVQINLPPQHNYSASSKPVLKNVDESAGDVDEGDAAAMFLEPVSIQQQVLEETIQSEIIQDLPTSETEISSQTIPELVSGYQNFEVQQEENSDGPTVIAIAEIDEQGQPNPSQVPVEYLQIIEELAPDSLEQQIVEVHYQQSEDQDQPVTESENTEKSANKEEQPPSTATSTTTTSSSSSSSSSLDFVTNPDFSCQEYYNWLSSFTELCKVVPMPLDLSLFQKISQVHKTLSDVMATPSGVVADKDNFKILMNISKDLNTIINEHLFYVMQNLDHSKETAS